MRRLHGKKKNNPEKRDLEESEMKIKMYNQIDLSALRLLLNAFLSQRLESHMGGGITNFT